ncbi:MAG: hypothetical protein M3R02_17385 [Chloroflexota bacterium]|nr:hypothetical protein [Chloroflexota bacterium]
MSDNAGNGMVTMTEAAGIAGVTIGTVFHWHWRGKLHAVKIRGRLMTTPQEVRRVADEMAQNPKGRRRVRERTSKDTLATGS